MIDCLRIAVILLLMIPTIGSQAPTTASQTSSSTTSPHQLAGRWRIKFTFAGRADSYLIFAAEPKNVGSFLLLDTAADGKPESVPRPAAWSQLTNDRISFSGEVELPISTCCREIGTLVFKGKFSSVSSLTGKIVFITSVDEEENPYQFRSLIGTFTATRLSN